MGKLKAKFPCGYEIKIESSVIQDLSENMPDLSECPIHGKECRKTNEKIKN